MDCSGVQDKPEKVRPNTSSSGFSIAFGVCVLVTVNLLASSAATRGAWTLYAQTAKRGAAGRKSEERSSRGIGDRSIVAIGYRGSWYRGKCTACDTEREGEREGGREREGERERERESYPVLSGGGEEGCFMCSGAVQRGGGLVYYMYV